jgi:2-phosphoglycerate kinase
VEKEEYTMPYSRGILANSLTRAGMDHDEAYRLAQSIKNQLIDEKKYVIHADELKEIVYSRIKKFDENVAKRYFFWEFTYRRRHPIIILIGGASGVGSSTLAFTVAQWLGISNVIGTDILREVLRKVISKELIPAIHKSSFNAWQAMKVAPREYDRVIYGFVNQVSHISVAIEAVLDRAVREGINVVVEGTHIVPGYIDEKYLKNNFTHCFILKLEDEEIHKQRFFARANETQTRRSAEYYIRHFTAIRKIHDFIVDNAIKNEIPVFENFNFENTARCIMRYVIEKQSRYVEQEMEDK